MIQNKVLSSNLSRQPKLTSAEIPGFESTEDREQHCFKSESLNTMLHSGCSQFIMHELWGHSMDHGFIFRKINKNINIVDLSGPRIPHKNGWVGYVD